MLQTEISVRFFEIDGELCVLCIGRDITKRRLAEAALKESEEKFARIFTGSPDGIVIISLADNRILDINDAFVGVVRIQLRGNRRASRQRSAVFDDIEQLKRSTEIVVKEGSLQNFELTFRTKNGEQIPALVSATVVELEGENSLVCIAKDNRVQRETEAKLRASEERFRGAFENAPIGMLLTDTDGYIFQANNFAVKALAYPEAEIVGSHISRLVPAPRTAEPEGNASTACCIAPATSSAPNAACCAKTAWRSGPTSTSCCSDPKPASPLYFIVQLADITEMKRNRSRWNAWRSTTR